MKRALLILIAVALLGVGKPHNETVVKPFGENGGAASSGALALHYLYPSDGATGLLGSDTLEWSITGGEGTVDYDVYFGTDNPPALRVTDTAGTAFAVTVNYDSTYYWRVVAVDDVDSIVGAVQSFTATIATPYLIAELGDFFRSDSNVYGLKAGQVAVGTANDTVITDDALVWKWRSMTSDTAFVGLGANERPTYHTDATFGKGLWFSGAGDWLRLTKPNYASDANAWTYRDTTLSWFVVMETHDTPNTPNLGGVLWARNSAGSASCYFLWLHSNTSITMRIRPGASNIDSVKTNQVADSTGYTFALSQSSADTARFYRNGVHLFSYGDKYKNTIDGQGYPLSLMGSSALYFNHGTVYAIVFARKHWTQADINMLTVWAKREFNGIGS